MEAFQREALSRNNASMTSSALRGSDECPCIDSTQILKSLTDCKTSSGFPGKKSENYFTNYLTCYPTSYGSSGCKAHDAYADPSCTGNPLSDPEYCQEKWCYVDVQKCKLSTELVFRSVLFEEAGLFYSYSTCNSKGLTFNDVLSTEYFKKSSKLTATIPGSFFPHHFKYTEDGNIATYSGPEYYNNSIPFHGALIDYMDKVVEFSNDIKEIKYEFRSKRSDISVPLSSGTASVRDVQVGFTDVAVGPLWVTSERLRLSAFTAPIAIDKILLVVKEPEENMSFSYQVNRIMNPFSTGLWVLLLFTIIAVAALSLWFASPKATNKRPWLAFRNNEWQRAGWIKKIFIINRQLLEAALQNGMFLFGASVDQDYRSTLSHKLLMFGFSFLIVITVSAYVASLAASLTLSGVSDYIDSMEKAITENARICAHPVSKEEFLFAWPKANFVFNQETPEYQGMIENFDMGKCNVIAASVIDTSHDFELLNKFCDRDLRFTNGLVIEIPIAFPVKKELAAGLSHYIYDAEKQLRFSYEQMYKRYEKPVQCNVNIKSQFRRESNEPLSPQYMIFPYFILWVFAGAAIVVKLLRRRNAVRAAKFIASVANLDETASTMIMDLASFAHLDIDYDEPLDLNSDPNKLSDEEKKDYLKRVSHRISIAITQNRQDNPNAFQESQGKNLSYHEDWRERSELERTISDRFLTNISMKESDEEMKSTGIHGGRRKRASIANTGYHSPSSGFSSISGLSHDEERLLRRDNSTAEIDDLMCSHASILFPIGEETHHTSTSDSLKSSSTMDLIEDNEFRDAVQQMVKDSLRDVIQQSMKYVITLPQGNAETSDMKFRSKNT